MGHKKYKKYYKSGKKNSEIIGLLIVLAIGFVMSFWYILLPLGLLIGYFYKRDAIHRFFLSNDIKRLQELTTSSKLHFDQYQLMLAEKGEDQASQRLKGDLLGRLFELDLLYQKTKKYLDAYWSQEAQAALNLRYRLQTPKEVEEVVVEEKVDPIVSEKDWIAQQAPEILETYCNVQKDNLVIREKLEATTDKREELEAIHDANMRRFEDILAGYLKIKSSPKDFFNAEERMSQAKLAMESFDKELDETIRQFNEADLRDFEISLRMMKKEEQTSHDRI